MKACFDLSKVINVQTEECLRRRYGSDTGGTTTANDYLGA